jgi:hypothetical protein
MTRSSHTSDPFRICWADPPTRVRHVTTALQGSRHSPANCRALQRSPLPEQQPADAFWITQATALQLDDPDLWSRNCCSQMFQPSKAKAWPSSNPATIHACRRTGCAEVRGRSAHDGAGSRDPQGIGLVSQPQAPMDPYPPNDMKPMILYVFSGMFRAVTSHGPDMRSGRIDTVPTPASPLRVAPETATPRSDSTGQVTASSGDGPKTASTPVDTKLVHMLVDVLVVDWGSAAPPCCSSWPW